MRALHLEVLRDSLICSSNIRVRVLIESVKAKLSSLALSESEFYYALLECLFGFQELYRRFGFIEVHRDMIGIDCHGKLKLWLNRVFSLNDREEESFLAEEQLIKRRRNPEHAMVRRIIEIVSKHAPSLRRGVRFEGTFKEALKYFDEDREARAVPICRTIAIP